MLTPRAEVRAYRRLIAGLALFEVTHALGLVAMVTLLLPGLDPALDAETRAAHVGTNALRWRLGWLPWQLSAASNVWITASLIGWARALEAPRPMRWAAASALCLLL